MHTDSFEAAFGDFLDRREYDQAENALFAMVRIAFLAIHRDTSLKGRPSDDIEAPQRRVATTLGRSPKEKNWRERTF